MGGLLTSGHRITQKKYTNEFKMISKKGWLSKYRFDLTQKREDETSFYASISEFISWKLSIGVVKRAKIL
jgi:hypothetical protein